MKNGTSIVEFPNFFHTDKRLDDGGYVDLSACNYKNENPSCAKIQLAKPSAIGSGQLKGKEGTFLAVVVDQELWIYNIHKISNAGLLEKDVTISRVPKDFVRFKKGATYLSYFDNKEKVRLLE